MDLIPMDTIHARRIRILKKAEETLDNHVDSRDNSAIPEFLANVEDVNDRAYLFQSAVLKLTCNNDWDTLGAVLKYGESDKENLDVQWIKVEEDNANTREVPCMKKEGRRNPLIVASEQASCCCSPLTGMIISYVHPPGLPSVHKTALLVWLPDSPSSIRHRAWSSWGTRGVSIGSGDLEPS